MGNVVREEGGKIHTDTPVKELLFDKKIVRGVRLENGEEVEADHVIINADFAHAMTHIVEEGKLRKYTPQKLENMKYSCSTFMLYLGVGREYSEQPHHNIIFAEDYKKNVEEIVESRILSEDPSIYVQNACVTDGTLAPKGKSTIYVLVPVPNNKSGINWQKEASAFRDKVLDLLETRGGFPELRDNLEEELMITPDDWEKEKLVYKGATFNLGHNIGQMLIFRPHNKFERVQKTVIWWVAVLIPVADCPPSMNLAGSVRISLLNRSMIIYSIFYDWDIFSSIMFG